MRTTGVWAMGAAALVMAALPARAEERTMRPGEYEITTQMEMEGSGHEVPPNTTRHCFTPEDVKDWHRIAQQNQRKGGDCEVKDMKTVGSHITWSMTCKSGAKGAAEVDYSAEGYKMNMDMEMPGGPHGAMKMKLHTTAKRTGDCKK